MLSPPSGTACPVCANPPLAYLALMERSIVRCPTCDLRWVDPLPSLDAIRRAERKAFVEGLLPETRGMFLKHGKNFSEDFLVRAYRDNLRKLSEYSPGKTLLDVGVGTGLYLHLAQEAGWTPGGVDLAPEAAETARREFGLEITTGDFNEAPLSRKMDVITMWDVLEHVCDPLAFARRAYETLAPEGILFVALPNCHNLLFRLVDAAAQRGMARSTAEKLYVPNHLFYFSPGSLARLLSSAGFEILRVEGARPYLGRYALHWGERVLLWSMFVAGGAVGLPGRVLIYARKPGNRST